MSDEKKTPGAGKAAGGEEDARSGESRAVEGSPEAELRAIPAAALEFLYALAPTGPWDLVAIDAEKKRRLLGTRFTPETSAEAAEWIERLNADGRNLYYHVNVVDDSGCEKAKKEQIVALRALHVDIDPRAVEDFAKERERILAKLLSFEPRPTVVVDSGGGYQPIWLLREVEPLPDNEARAAAEARNLALELALGGDHCHDLPRVMRLPGTVNWPDAKKRAKRRTARLACVVDADWTRCYESSEFAPAKVQAAAEKPAARVAVTPGKGLRPEDLDLSKLPTSRRESLIELLREGRTKKNDFGGDRSRAVYRACLEMVRAGVSQEIGSAVLLNPNLAIHAHIRDAGHGRMARYAARQMARALVEIESSFELNDKGLPLPTPKNIRLALAKLDVHVSYDRFADRMLVDGLAGLGPLLDDAALNRLFVTVIEKHQLRVGIDFFWTVLQVHARDTSFHPVLEYFGALQWDGTPRLDRWLTAYGGADDTELTRAVGALTLIAAVRRIREPGCKFDEMLVLESQQGMNKSTALATLAIEPDWFSDDLPLDAEAQRVIETLRGRLIIEAGELGGLRKGDIDRVKAFLSRPRDAARMAYGRTRSESPRQCIFVGTTNNSKYLSDGTGNRRFWPVGVRAFDIAALARDRDQLWAEAAAREAAGESIRLDPRLYGAAAEQQEARRIEDPWVQVFEAALGDRPGKLRATDAWALVDVAIGQRNQTHNARLHASLAELGFKRSKLRFGGHPEGCYIRGGQPEQLKAFILKLDAGGRVASVGYEVEPPF